MQNTGTCYPGLGWICQVHLGFGLSASAQVPDKPALALGSMSPYSAQILICFIAYIFFFFFPLWVWLGTVQDCHHAQCPLPLSIVIRMRLAIRQSKLPACLAEVQLAFKILSGIYATGLVKLTDKMDEICINGKFEVQEPSEWRYFCIPVSNFTVSQPRIYTWFQQCWNLVKSVCFEFDRCHTAFKQEFESIFQAD